MAVKFHVIRVSDENLLASYAKCVGSYAWEFIGEQEFQEWLQYAVLSDQTAGMLQWPSGRMTHIAIHCDEGID